MLAPALPAARGLSALKLMVLVGATRAAHRLFPPLYRKQALARYRLARASRLMTAKRCSGYTYDALIDTTDVVFDAVETGAAWQQALEAGSSSRGWRRPTTRHGSGSSRGAGHPGVLWAVASTAGAVVASRENVGGPRASA